MSQEENKSPLNLGEFIAVLEKLPEQDCGIMFDFGFCMPTGHLCSYRGYYEDVALNFTGDYSGPSVKNVAMLVKMLKEQMGTELTAWKGGEYIVKPSRRLWVANPGNTGDTQIMGIRLDGFYVIETRYNGGD